MSKYLINIFFLLLCAQSGIASTIQGFAPDFIGEKIVMYTYSDYLTMTKIKLAEAVVKSSDSSFVLEYDIKRIYKVLLEVGNTNAEIYIQPKQSYEIYYKRPDNYIQSFASQKAVTYFKNLDSTDINYKVLEFGNWFDEYLFLNQSDILQGKMAQSIDTFKQYAYEAYAHEKNLYFVNYVRYYIGALEKAKIGIKYKKPRAALYYEYIEPFPVFAFNDQYMEYIKGFYGNDFNGFSNDIQSDIVLAIYHSSPSRLMQAMHRDPFFEKDEIRELMMVNMLGNAYYTGQYKQENVKVMLDSVAKFAKFRSSALASNNILNQVTTVAPGYPAPTFSFEIEDETVNLQKYKDKFVYINFFAQWNTNSVKEMLIIEELEAKYGDFVQFISFSADKNKADFDKFKTEHATFRWPIIFLGESHPLLKDYRIASIPYFTLIDQSGFIASSPALSPSPDGVGRTIEGTFKRIKTELDGGNN